MFAASIVEKIRPGPEPAAGDEEVRRGADAAADPQAERDLRGGIDDQQRQVAHVSGTAGECGTTTDGSCLQEAGGGPLGGAAVAIEARRSYPMPRRFDNEPAIQ